MVIAKPVDLNLQLGTESASGGNFRQSIKGTISRRRRVAAISRNAPVTGLRAFKAIEAHKL
jgi:hypothetical protein